MSPMLRALVALAVAAPTVLAAQEELAAGSACLAIGPTPAAIEPCRLAVRDHPGDLAFVLRLAEAMAAAGDDRAALATYGRALSLAPDSAEPWFGAARLHDRRGDRSAALRHYREFSRLTPGDAAGPEITGWLLLEMRRPSEALRAFRDASGRDPASAGGALGAGLALLELGRRDEACRQLEYAVRLAPGSAEAWGALARVTVDAGREREAAAFWERALLVDAGYFDRRAAERRAWERATRRHGVQAPAAMGPTTLASARLVPDSVPPRIVRVPGAAPRMRRTGVFTGGGTTGSGFVVSRAGHVLTNRHVVRACAAVRVRGDDGVAREARVVALDPDDDLALLRVDTRFADVAAFRGGREPRPGESVMAVGFPLNGLLADEVHVTTGAVSALAGLYNDVHELTVSTPVQPGNSGGPLLDDYGTVVGVVVTKLNAKLVAEEMGDLPQNVNFAIKAGVAREFLAAQGIAPLTGLPTHRLAAADVGDVGRKVTVLVECTRAR